MANIEIDCDECGYHAEGAHCEACKTICIHCWNAALKEIARLKKQLAKLQKKVDLK